jgi:hypothetical protein
MIAQILNLKSNTLSLFTYFLRVSVVPFDHRQVENTNTESEKCTVEEVTPSQLA